MKDDVKQWHELRYQAMGGESALETFTQEGKGGKKGKSKMEDTKGKETYGRGSRKQYAPRNQQHGTRDETRAM